jgi:glutamate-1-semialdehyde 2,1-aminomutase
MIMVTFSKEKILKLISREEKTYVSMRPRSRELFERAKKSLVGGVPMSWMRIWSGGFPIFVKDSEGCRLTDVDNNQYVDFCLGDTGGLFGHANKIICDAVDAQMRKGMTHMLPTEDAIYVGEELTRRFGLPFWQVLMTATDANRMALKIAKELTGRKKVLTFNGCYHGSVDETLVCNLFGQTVNIPGMIGPFYDDPSVMTKVIEFNDVGALEKALAEEDVAVVITEPVMSNVGIIHPVEGFHMALRELTRKHGTYLLIDETHCICAGPAGITGEWGLKPDIITFGKPISGGFPAGVMGLSKEIAEKLEARIPWHTFFGFGGTLSGNATAIAAMKACLEKVITREKYDYMIPLATELRSGIQAIIDVYKLPWYVSQIGCRVEFKFSPTPPRNGFEAELKQPEYNQPDVFTEGLHGPMEILDHLYTLNRGILLSPVHNMMLVSPHTTKADVEKALTVLKDMVKELVK